MDAIAFRCVLAGENGLFEPDGLGVASAGRTAHARTAALRSAVLQGFCHAFLVQSSLSFFVLFLSLAFFFYFLSCRLLPRALWLVFVSRCFVSNGFWFAPGGEPVDRARHPAPRRLCGAGAGRRPVRAAGVAGVASGLDRPTFDRRRRLRTDAFLHSQGVFFSSLGLQPAGVVTHRLRTPISQNGLPLGS